MKKKDYTKWTKEKLIKELKKRDRDDERVDKMMKKHKAEMYGGEENIDIAEHAGKNWPSN